MPYGNAPISIKQTNDLQSDKCGLGCEGPGLLTVNHLGSDGARSAQRSWDPLVSIQIKTCWNIIDVWIRVQSKQDFYCLVISLRYIQASPLLQELLPLRGPPRCPVRSSSVTWITHKDRVQCIIHSTADHRRVWGWWVMPSDRSQSPATWTNFTVYGDGT